MYGERLTSVLAVMQILVKHMLMKAAPPDVHAVAHQRHVNALHRKAVRRRQRFRFRTSMICQ